MSILVTGSAGFIGSNFLFELISTTDQNVISLDALTYAGNINNLNGINSSNHQFIKGDICDLECLESIFSRNKISMVYHFAAESHVDRSILGSDPFIQTNIVGTHRLLEMSKKYEVEKFIHISTDEVYGSLSESEPAFTETHPIQPNSPYSASKASSDLLVRSYNETFGLPTLITRCSNNYGPYQFPEKLIPLMIHNAMNNKPLPVYGNGENIRDWIYVLDHAQAILEVAKSGRIGQIYNIGGNCEMKNIDIVQKIIDICGASNDLITYVKDRPGHDFRYAMDNTKITAECGWTPKVNFENGLSKTIDWYKDNQSWLDNIISGDYQKYYEEQYSE